MKYAILFFSVLSLFLVKQAKALQEDTMDTLKTTIVLNDPSYGSSSSRILKSHNGFRYTVNRNKTLFVTAPPNYSLLVSIKYIDLRPYSRDVLTLYSLGSMAYPVRYSNTASYKKKIYYPKEEQTYFVKSGNLGINFYTGPSSDNFGYDGFELIYTVQGSWPYCNSRDFLCTNGRCIADILKCDGHNHCGDGSSQRDCFIINSSGRTIGAIFGSIFLVIAIACGVFIICRRRRGTAIETRIVTSHPPPAANLPSYPPVNSQTGYYPPPPPPYSQGISNQGYH